MEFVYRSAFLIGITLLVPLIFKYLTAKSKEDDTAVYTVKMRSNMMKVHDHHLHPIGSYGDDCFFRIFFIQRLGEYVLYSSGNFC